MREGELDRSVERLSEKRDHDDRHHNHQGFACVCRGHHRCGCCCQSELAFPLLGKLVLMVDHPSIILPTICPVTDTKPRLPMSFLAIF